MPHPIYKITQIKIKEPYKLEIYFDDETVRSIDFEPILHGEMFGPLRDVSLFNQVKVDSEVHTIVWPNGADFDPAVLHDWDEYKEELAERAKSWKVLMDM